MTDPEDYTIGVVVARLQVDDIHEGHHYVIQQVDENHGKIIIFLGVPYFVGNLENPLDFNTRKLMVQQDYPNAVIMSLPDQETNPRWASELDRRVREVFPESHGDVLMYGSRDSFIPSYKKGGGEFDSTELKQLGTYTGTDIRKKISERSIGTRDFRYGCIYTAYNTPARIMPAVYIIPSKSNPVDGEDDKILLAKKFFDTKYRFIGAIVKGDGDTLESMGKSILSKKIGSMETDKFEYLFSSNLNDWRVRGSRDTIMATVFETKLLYGHPQPYNGYEEVREFAIKDLRKELMIESHQPLLEQYLKIKN